MRYKITATRLLEANVRCMRYEALIMCVAMFYIRSCFTYLFSCGENKEVKINDFGEILVELSSPK